MDKHCIVHVEKFAEKQIRRLPKVIQEALIIWSQTIQEGGISSMRKLPGYHDEPLKGARKGQRSARLNRAYRVIYEERETSEILIIAVMEVNKHDY